jgi:hypothetical protein
VTASAATAYNRYEAILACAVSAYVVAVETGRVEITVTGRVEVLLLLLLLLRMMVLMLLLLQAVGRVVE